MTAKPRVGFVGVGKMGRPMAERLLAAGYPLVIADADPTRLAGFGEGATVAATLAELGRMSAMVITMLPDGKAVREVLLGRRNGGDRVLGGLERALVIDMSSASPVGTRALGEELARSGIGLIDAPVSGGVKRALDGSLAIMVGGEPSLIERARPLLAAMGRQIFMTGPLGSGHAMKALNNYVSAAGLAAAAEALTAGERFGLEPALMVDILNASTGRNNSTENKLKQFVLSGRFDAGFSLGLMAKDLRTALETARAMKAPAPLGEACVALWSAAEERLGGGADHTEIARYLAQIAEEMT
ncbi:MAG: NAD(P)-dependent oxidoreductase [Alphaproteobacteria bacterium]|nr:NAD(P)-dependent oxidoreductase [Alphaproteobacteria bacterium]